MVSSSAVRRGCFKTVLERAMAINIIQGNSFKRNSLKGTTKGIIFEERKKKINLLIKITKILLMIEKINM